MIFVDFNAYFHDSCKKKLMPVVMFYVLKGIGWIMFLLQHCKLLEVTGEQT